MNILLTTLIITFFYISFSASAMCATEKPHTTSDDVITCKDPRPQICTREYIPVCATKKTSVVCITTPCPSTEDKTYPTGCTACADPKVIKYKQGKCE